MRHDDGNKETNNRKEKTNNGKKENNNRKQKTGDSKKENNINKKKTNIYRKETRDNRTPLAERQRERTTFDFSSAPKEIQELTAYHEPHIELLPQQTMQIIMSEIHSFMREFQEWSENNLTLVQRRRKIGAGIRNYGAQKRTATAVWMDKIFKAWRTQQQNAPVRV